MTATTGAARADRNSLAWRGYRARLDRLRRDYRAIPDNEPVRLAKKTSNLFRPRARAGRPGLDVAGFDGILEVDAGGLTADVLGMTTYEDLVDATLAHELMPLVVPELKTITIGGAVTGLGIESSSWINGMPHESVVELDVLTGGGDVVTASRDNEHRDLFYGFPNSYGTLGYAVRLKIELQPVQPFVHLRHVRFTDFAELVEVLGSVCSGAAYEGEPVDFVDGTVFSPGESYLTLGSWSTSAPWTSDYTYMDIYYRSIQRRSSDWLTVRDYLWRWDTDWFWCSRAFMAQYPLVRRLAGRRFLRSDVYWRLLSFEERHHLKAWLDARRGMPERENVIQDVQIPLPALAEFVDSFQRELRISPIWLCPLRLRERERSWDLYRLDPSVVYVNVGFWSSVPIVAVTDPHHHNRWVEEHVDRLGGRKSLYSTAFYDEGRFWQLYGGDAYRALKQRYDPSSRLADLYQKSVGSG